MKNKQFWLVLEPYVYISIKNERLLLYNSLNGEEIYYKHNPGILKIFRKFADKKNLRSIKLSQAEIRNDKEIIKLVGKLKKHFMGDLIDEELCIQKPINFPPEILVKNDKLLHEDSKLTIGNEVMLNLFELSLYINSRCEMSCSACNYAYKQFLFCFKGDKYKKEINLKKIMELIDEARGSSMVRINILGGNIFLYQELEELILFLNNIKIEKCYYIHYKNLQNQIHRLSLIDDKSSKLNVLITSPLDRYTLKSIVSQTRECKINKNFLIVVMNNKGLEMTNELKRHYRLDNIEIYPCYNRRNITFFKKNIFNRKDSILEAKPSIKTILRRTVINPIFYGRIIVLNDGRIFSNINNPSLGKIENNSLYDIVYKEMVNSRSWRKLRRHTDPCKQCVYDNLCPPLSNYEFAIGKNNLCHVYK